MITVFGRRQEVNAAFDRENQDLFTAGFGAQFISGLIMPTIIFIGSVTYLALAVIGGLRVAGGTMSLGTVQALISYAGQLTHPLSQLASMMNLLQSGVASAERVFEVFNYLLSVYLVLLVAFAIALLIADARFAVEVAASLFVDVYAALDKVR